MGGPDGERRGVLGWLLRVAARVLLVLPRGVGCVLAVLWLGVIRWVGHGGGGLSREVSWLAFALNTGHAVLYGVLALWLLLVLPRRDGWPRIDGAAWRAVLASVFTFGLADELLQAFDPSRNGSLLDLVTDVVGAACVLAVAARVTAPADERGLRLRLLGAVACTLLAGGAATILPEIFPGATWL